MHDLSLPEAMTTEVKRHIQVSDSSGDFKTCALWPPFPPFPQVRHCVFHADVQTWLIKLWNILPTTEVFIPYTYYFPLLFGKGKLLELKCWNIYYYINYDHIILWSPPVTLVEKMASVALKIK